MRPHLKPLVKQLLGSREISLHAAEPADALHAPSRPYPNGWFCLAFSDELRAGSLTTRRLAGAEVVLYRTAKGVLRAVRPQCPHLGAHLGVGGSVEGEDIVCPFHRFAFDPSGACVRTGYDQPPPKASLTQYPVCEANGSVYVWWHALGMPPQWDVPLFPMDDRQPFSHGTFDIAGHPQDVIENAFDWGHLPALHGLEEVDIEGLPVTGEPVSTVTAMARNTMMRGFHQSYTLTVIGLATIAARTVLPAGAGSLYVMLHATPTAPGRMQVRFGTKLELNGLPGVPDWLGRPAVMPLARLLSEVLQRVGSVDTGADLLMWHHQEHVARPRLAKGDGPIGRYRQWAQQFYTEPAGDLIPPRPERTEMSRSEE
ncbi:aromatic ring-hydroxylating oxygenase subunit alpha [Streptomyces violaceusniger]|uniref:cholesterol 7-desaturase n=1 Tax=Streptomyces violaceusniger (strain Tu 4113) TaxID=653045 RepID=G2PFH6_STRV4|nr:Rieske 2Fe-2S domain-containing protein [Streptomyces violaceusniger]AEM84537.1 Rieske (2Fe-2S) iron-sulfur domain-containing protein [Streptomyces violaceusniger Tu 4113]